MVRVHTNHIPIQETHAEQRRRTVVGKWRPSVGRSGGVVRPTPNKGRGRETHANKGCCGGVVRPTPNKAVGHCGAVVRPTPNFLTCCGQRREQENGAHAWLTSR